MGEIFVYILVFCVLGWEVAALSSYIWLSIKRRSSKKSPYIKVDTDTLDYLYGFYKGATEYEMRGRAGSPVAAYGSPVPNNEYVRGVSDGELCARKTCQVQPAMNTKDAPVE